MHKRLLDPVLAALDEERAFYFSQVGEKLNDDARIERNSNIVFLVLAAAAPYLPTQLPQRDFIGRLIAFVDRNQHRIVRTAFDPDFLSDKDLIKPVIAEFVQETTALVLKGFDEGRIDPDHGTSIIKMTWPIDPSVFPYVDDDEDDEWT